MSWVRVDDAFLDHRKFLEVGPVAGFMALAALAWSNRNLTDGHIPHAQVGRLIDLEGVSDQRCGDGVTAASQIAELLVGAGLWETEPGGYRIHDYTEFQLTAAQIRHQRQKTAVRTKNWRARNTVSDAVTNGVSDGPVTGAPNPNPLTPPPKSPRGGPHHGRKRDRQTFERDVAAYTAEHFPHLPAPQATHAVRQAIDYGQAETLEQIRAWIAEHFPDLHHQLIEDHQS